MAAAGTAADLARMSQAEKILITVEYYYSSY